MRQVMTAGIVAAASVALATLLAAQGGPGSSSDAATAQVLAATGMTPIVGNLEEAAGFYAELVGLPNTPQIRRRSHSDVPYPEVLKNQGTPDATIRQINLDIPGSAWRIEVLEFSDIESKAVAARIQDPGAMTIVLSVRDVDGLLAKLRNLKSQVVTPGGEPVAVTVGTNRARAVVIKAPGGHFIELRQPDPLPADPALPAGNVIGGHIRVTIADTDATLRLYRDQLGLSAGRGAFHERRVATAVDGDSRRPVPRDVDAPPRRSPPHPRVHRVQGHQSHAAPHANPGSRLVQDRDARA